MNKSKISTPMAPKAIGAYSQGIKVSADSLIFISGQLGLKPDTGEFISKEVGDQAQQAMDNIGEILKAAGGDYSNIVKATILLADISDFATVNDVYASYFAADPPARAAFAVKTLPKDARVEIEAIAAL